jgi:uncharacterized protein (TIGR03437 family)
MNALMLLGLLTSAALAAVPNLSILPGASPAGVAADSQGNIYVAGSTESSAFPATPGALQTQLLGSSDAFIAKFSSSGALIWATYFGGSGYDIATCAGVDPAGNVLVAGETESKDLPVLHAFQNSLKGGDNAFVLKLNPAGQIVYSTYLGGSANDRANALAVDSAGSVYLAGKTFSTDFPGQTGLTGQTFVAKLDASGAFVYSWEYSRPNQGPSGIAVDSGGSAYVVGQPYGSAAPDPHLRQAYAIKLSADGSHLLYESFFGGSQTNYETAIAVDSTGAAYIAGTTDSVDFPQVDSLQPSIAARPLWKSIDGGNTWAPLDNLPFAYLQALAPDPTAPGTLYAGASDLGIFKTVNGGATWAGINQGIANPQIYTLAMNPANTAILYAGGGFEATYPEGGWIYQTEDSGAHWSMVDSPSYIVNQLVIDPLLPLAVYAMSDSTVAKTSNAGASWNPISTPADFGLQSVAVDPNTEGTVYASSLGGEFYFGFLSGGFSQPAAVYRSADAGNTWQQLANVAPSQPGLVIDPSTKPATIYAGAAARSNDGGNTWTPLTAPFGKTTVTAMAADPASGALYAAAVTSNSLEVSTDRGQTWTSTGWPYGNSTITAITPTSAALYATVQNTQTSAFVVKLSPDGSTVLYSTLLSGHPSPATVELNECGPTLPLQCWDPAIFASQNYATGIALDPAGNIIVVGGTRSADLPTASPMQPANAGGADAFISVISTDGSQLRYSSYLGGSLGDGAAGVTVDSQGNVTVVGQTSSTDFLGAAVPQGQYATGFVVKALPTPPVGPPAIASVLNGASFQPGIAAGSWVAVKGSNLANTVAQAASGNLPTALDGVSVTIDGKPAFVEYISPRQINVQAPSDSAVGTVNVLVNNNGAVSAPAPAQLAAAAPAFFMYPDTNNAVASRLPGYAQVGQPSAPAKPGDTLVLWGTGFGATNPAVAAGTMVTGTPATLALPVVTVGGMPVTVIGSILTAGSVGLYQVTIQLPANVQTGAVAIQASVGGVSTPAGVTILVENP